MMVQLRRLVGRKAAAEASSGGQEGPGSATEEPSRLSFATLGYLHSGEYFGEHSCLLAAPRAATFVASSHCELYTLARADLEEVLQQWPELLEEFQDLGGWLGPGWGTACAIWP
jgi:hypothetical protein